MKLTTEETNFLQSILSQVVPNMQVPAKEAPAILALCESILTKLNEVKP